MTSLDNLLISGSVLYPPGATVIAGPTGPAGPKGDPGSGSLGWVNVLEKGVANTGLSDQTSKIQAVLNSVTDGATVYFPRGTYIVDPAIGLTPKANTVMAGDGPGTVLKVADGRNATGNFLRATHMDHGVIRDLVLEGNRTNQTGNFNNYGLFLDSCKGARVERVIIRNFTGVGFQAYNCDGGYVTGCESYGNLYHGFENEQCREMTWVGNYGHNNDRHGMFVSPGEVGGTGSSSNSFIGNVFSDNTQYGLSIGSDASANQGSSWLSVGNVVAYNVAERNGDFGLQVYKQDRQTLQGNVVRSNGLIGIHVYQSADNVISGNQLVSNCTRLDGWDEILVEHGDGTHVSARNRITDNKIQGGRARFGINESTSTDGPNVIKDNDLTGTFASAQIRLSHPATERSVAAGTVQVYGGQTINGQGAGMDNAFNLLRIYTTLPNGNMQFVAPNGVIDAYVGGQNTVTYTSEGLRLNGQGTVFAAPDGSLKYRSPGGTVTTIAPA